MPLESYILVFDYIEYSSIFSKYDYVFISQSPKPIETFDQMVYTFKQNVWLALFLSFTAMMLVFKLIHYVYSTKALEKYNLAGKVTHHLDFILLTFASITEPDPIPWFPKPSAGYTKC